MFFTYLRRELRRRSKQAIAIAIGLALGVGLVITVTAASAGVKKAQGQVLESLYGVGTDLTVTQAPAAGTGGTGRFGFGVPGSSRNRPTPGTKFTSNRLVSGQLGSISSSAVGSIGKLHGVAVATGGLTLTDVSVSGTIPSFAGGFPASGGSGSRRGFVTPTTFGVSGVDIAGGAIGPLASGKVTAGRTFSSGDAHSDVAVIDSNYATQRKLKVGSTIAIGSSTSKSTSFRIVGIVRAPAGSTADVYVPLAQAQSLAALKNQVDTVYVAATSASLIDKVQGEIKAKYPKATVTTASSLASQLTGSLSSAGRLITDLGTALAAAVLAAAFALACVLTLAAVSRRVSEFGTLKALGWRSSRVIRQVMGEALAIGLAGAAIGVGLGFAGAALVGKFAPSLTAIVGQTTGSATPGGSRVFSGGGGGFGGGGGGGFGGGFRRAAANATPTIPLHLTATVALSAILAAALLAIAGGLIAGGFGGWRAARLRPAAALAKIG